jgi:ABC-type uncharacterized transport system ATPase subunit
LPLVRLLGFRLVSHSVAGVRFWSVADNPAILAEGLHKRYRGTVALASLDLRVTEGGVHAVLGPNGAGKPST